MVRYAAAHKDEVRERLLREGGALIKRRGLRGLSLHQMAKSLGVSVSGLYTYFPGRDAMVGALLEAETARSVANFEAMRAAMEIADDPLAVVERFVGTYLGLAHVRAPETGCVMPAVASDMPMQSDALRATYSGAARKIADAIDASLPNTQSVGAGLLGTVIGAVALARASADDADASAILDSARRTVSAQLNALKEA